MQLLRCFTSTMVYGSLVFIPMLLCTLATLIVTDVIKVDVEIEGESGQQARNSTAGVLYLLAALYLCIFCCLRRRIPLTITLLKTAGDAISAKLYVFLLCFVVFVLYVRKLGAPQLCI